jgi:RNA polymerase sigma factor (sigma-70 family)
MDPDIKTTIEEAIAGDHGAFEMIIREYSRTVYAIAFGVVHNAAVAEDIVQETFLKAYKNRKKIRDSERFLQWIFSVARNLSKDHLRKKPLVQFPEDPEEIKDEAAPDPHRTLEDSERNHKVHSALKGLPEHHRLAITLRYLEGMDHQTIEETMGLSNGALRGILGRGLEALRQTLKPLQQA